MGCYGIGLGRIMASVVEQNNDEKGIIFPMAIAPYKVCIVPANMKDEAIVLKAENIYKNLENKGIDTLLDDRNERLGVKFNDMDLIGIPIRITVGKKLENDMVEVKLRKDPESVDIRLSDLEEYIERIIKQ